MFCTKCGAYAADGSKFCVSCGAVLEQPAAEPAPAAAPVDYNAGSSYSQSYSQSYTQSYAEGPAYTGAAAYTPASVQGAFPKKVGFVEGFTRAFKNYAQFEGRATRSEYWYFTLANMLISGVIGIIEGAAGQGTFFATFLTVLLSMYSLATLIPGLALSIRRMHDIGRKWSAILIMLIPVAGVIIFLIWLCKKSDVSNNWGPDAETAAKMGLKD